MHINSLCKLLALQQVYQSNGVEPGSGLLRYELQRLWEETGLRRNDLEDALMTALLEGQLAEFSSDEGWLAVLTGRGFEAQHAVPDRVRDMEERAKATAALEWARARLRRGIRLGRRRDDPAVLH